MGEVLTRVGAKLALLPDLHGRRRSHGEVGHRFQLLSPVPESEVADFEERHGVRLPEGYRRFLIEVAGGGTGPGYGLTTLTANDHPSTDYAMDSIVFDGNPDPAGWLESLNDDTDPWVGTIEIAHHGCSDYTHLVLTGKEHGRVFIENLDAADYYFTGNDFLSWYETWLDQTSGDTGHSSRTAHSGDEAALITVITSERRHARRFRAAWTLAMRPGMTPTGLTALMSVADDAPDPAVKALAVALVRHFGA
ncbi:SMI1/KNR4 family protein [Phytomonospora endophytica]|nr:SMI1/KNR4 family protein [Phytomonospora endophytica]GIG70540.1 hypothetical protein Pen01_68350 [Phytomonospora endophytica]